MYKYFLIINFLFFQNICLAELSVLYTPTAKSLNPESYILDVNALYSLSAGTYDVSGTKTNFDGSDSYSLMEGNLDVGYGIGKKLDVFLKVKFRNVDTTYEASSGTISTTNSGLESFIGSFKYSFDPTDSLWWAIELSYYQTPYENTEYLTSSLIPDNDIVLGDSGSGYSFGLHTSYKRKRGHYLNSLITYYVPPNNLSSEINYRFQSAWLWTKFGFILGIQGISSLSSDVYSSTPDLKPIQATGSSSRFNSINRERLEPFLGMNWGFKKWRLEIEGGQTLAGKSTDHASYVKIGMVYQSLGVSGDSFKIGAFKEYVIDATVLKVSPRGKFLKIDQGISSDVEKGMKFDIFQTDYFGENILVASGVAYEIKSDTTIIKIVKKYKRIKIKKGFAARGY